MPKRSQQGSAGLECGVCRGVCVCVGGGRRGYVFSTSYCSLFPIIFTCFSTIFTFTVTLAKALSKEICQALSNIFCQ